MGALHPHYLGHFHVHKANKRKGISGGGRVQHQRAVAEVVDVAVADAKLRLEVMVTVGGVGQRAEPQRHALKQRDWHGASATVGTEHTNVSNLCNGEHRDEYEDSAEGGPLWKGGHMAQGHGMETGGMGRGRTAAAEDEGCRVSQDPRN